MSGKNRLFKSGKLSGSGEIFARAGFRPEPEPKSGTALISNISSLDGQGLSF